MGIPQMCNKFVEAGCEQFAGCCDERGKCRYNDDGSPISHSLIQEIENLGFFMFSEAGPDKYLARDEVLALIRSRMTVPSPPQMPELREQLIDAYRSIKDGEHVASKRIDKIVEIVQRHFAAVPVTHTGCREAFENWFEPSGKGLERDRNGNYRFITAHSAWGAWQAAWGAALSATPPAPAQSLVDAVRDAILHDMAVEDEDAAECFAKTALSVVKAQQRQGAIAIAAAISTSNEFLHIESPLILRVVEETLKATHPVAEVSDA